MQARKFAEGIHAKFPGKLLAYNCSPSFNWQKNLGDAEIATFQQVQRRPACAALPRVPLPLCSIHYAGCCLAACPPSQDQESTAPAHGIGDVCHKWLLESAATGVRKLVAAY